MKYFRIMLNETEELIKIFLNFIFFFNENMDVYVIVIFLSIFVENLWGNIDKLS